MTVLYVTTHSQHGLVIYTDDNEYGLVLDDGTLLYTDKTALRYSQTTPANFRVAIWNATAKTYAPGEQQRKHYSRTLKHFLLLAGEAGKKCSICNVHKPYSSYRKNSDSYDGYKPSCKECAKNT